jgi:IPT/TIG domain
MVFNPMRRALALMPRLVLALVAMLALAPVAAASLITGTITSVTPSSGPTAGGTAVTVRGTGLSGAGQLVVRFDGVEADTTVVQYGTEFRAIAPPHAAGPVTVDIYESIRTPPVIASLANGFTYEAPLTAPTITAVSPATGPTTGGTSVTLTGTNFTGATAVSFGGTAASAFTVNSATSITATTPARAAGAVDIAVTAPGGTATSAKAFTFIVYRTLTVKTIAGLMARGDARYGATQSDTGAFATTSESRGSAPIRRSGYAEGIYCGTRTIPVKVPDKRTVLGAPWISEISTGTSCSMAYPTGTKVTLTALPSASLWRVISYILGVPVVDGTGWLSGWGGTCKGTTGTTCSVTMDQDRSVNVAFSGSGINLDLAGAPGRFVLFNVSSADPETGRINSFDVGWNNSTPSSSSPTGFIGFTTEVVGGSANARDHAATGPVVCRKSTPMRKWAGRVTCPVSPALARRLAAGPVRLRTTVTLKLKGNATPMTVGLRTTVLRNAAGTRVTG